MGIFDKLFSKKKLKESLDKGLNKTSEGLFEKLRRSVAGKSRVDDELLDELESVLISSDVGVETTLRIIERIEARVSRDKYVDTKELSAILRDEIILLLGENNRSEFTDFELDTTHKPHVIMVVGVNGVGKTTTIGKLASHYTQRGKKVVLGAADTFRAAAVDQLIIWSERAGCEIVQKGMG